MMLQTETEHNFLSKYITATYLSAAKILQKFLLFILRCANYLATGRGCMSLGVILPVVWVEL